MGSEISEITLHVIINMIINKAKLHNTNYFYQKCSKKVHDHDPTSFEIIVPGGIIFVSRDE